MNSALCGFLCVCSSLQIQTYRKYFLMGDSLLVGVKSGWIRLRKKSKHELVISSKTSVINQENEKKMCVCLEGVKRILVIEKIIHFLLLSFLYLQFQSSSAKEKNK